MPGTAPLAQDIVLSRPADDIPDGVEVIGKVELPDQRQLVFELLQDFGGRLLLEHLHGTLLNKLPQEAMCIQSCRYHFLRIMIPELIEVELTTVI